MPIILDIPFDEAAGSPIAPDFGPQQTHAVMTNGTFVPGHNGYSGRFKGEGYGRTRNTHIDLSADFTVTAWIRNRQYGTFSAPEGVIFQFAFVDGSGHDIRDFQTSSTTLGAWEHWAMVKTSSGATIYKNAQQIGTIDFTGTASPDPVEWAIQQVVPGGGFVFDAEFDMTFGDNTAPFGQDDIDELLIFNEALTAGQIGNIFNPPDRHVLYWIDDIKFLDYDIYVSDSAGMIDALTLKDSAEVDWANEHGLIKDLKRPRFRPREINLQCFFKAADYLEFSMKLNEFLALFTGSETHRLKVEIDEHKPLVFEVYLPEGTDIKKKWRPDEFYGTFELNLVEYLPVKKVLRFMSTATQNTAVIDIQCKTPFNIYWGDGSATKDVIDSASLTHTYTEDKVYQIILAGVLEDITALTHNGIEIWNRL